MKNISVLICVLFFTALQTLSAVVELENATEEQIQNTYEKAVEDYSNKNYEQSLNHIRHVIKSDMRNYRLRMLAAHNHWRQGNFKPAGIHFSTAISAEPTLPGTYIDYSLMLLQQNRENKARDIIIRGIRRVRRSGAEVPPKMFNILSRIELKSGRIKSALANAEKAKAAYAKNTVGIKDRIESLLLEGRSHLALKNYEEAELAISWGISLRKNNPYAYNLLGLTYEEWAIETPADKPAKAARIEKAAANYRKALASGSLAADFRNLIEQNLERVNSL